ncbi:hypothetical protein COB11_08455 [Candidatus Aerophobetes bacterium]|uniref:Potassium channel domain-containing protein n=1 Tax=Aerophobetes bacterium TaxID=2030807 RepID=A0A2A4Y959_UNCAE|nr:MAG: hypothetical protein COB11_08455 [Candidatus Aerophobetes bacterium]
MAKKIKTLEAKPTLVTFCSKYFNLLLIFLILLFVFRPYNRSGVYIGIWQLCFIGVFISSIFNCRHHKSIKTLATAVAIPALLCNWFAHFYMITSLELTHLILTFIFICICVGSIISRVILNAKVTLETLRGVVCVYFMIAFGFSYLYLLIEYWVPGSFYFIEGIIKLPSNTILNHNHILSESIFYSFVTLLTIGFGNIHAISDIAQTATILEGMLGQFYIAILVSRIISVYSFYSHKDEVEPVAFSSDHEDHT